MRSHKVLVLLVEGCGYVFRGSNHLTFMKNRPPIPNCFLTLQASHDYGQFHSPDQYIFLKFT